MASETMRRLDEIVGAFREGVIVRVSCGGMLCGECIQCTARAAKASLQREQRAAQDEIDRLTRELEEAQRQRDAANRRHDDMCREVRSLTAYLFDRHKAMRELEAARAENRRLREALERVVDGGCERFVSTDCWQMGMDPNARDYADRVCDPCFVRRALAKDTEASHGE